MVFPSIEPYDAGWLDVGDGHSVHWDASGNPDGQPALVIHGGPGSGSAPASRRFFDPHHYRIALFDQRGAGQSRPPTSVMNPLTANTTHHLVADVDRLRHHLGVDQWVLLGRSWGSTLAVAYAEAHPEQVRAMVLSSVALTRPRDIEWLYHGVGRFLPAEWAEFRDHLPESDRGGDLVAGYYQLLHLDPDPVARARAAAAWCAWEDAVSPLPGGGPNPRYADAGFRVMFARTVTHYFHHRAWLEEDQLLRAADRLRGIPGVLVHGRLDIGGPLEGAWQLAQRWTGASLEVVDTGHTGGPAMQACIGDALRCFAGGS